MSAKRSARQSTELPKTRKSYKFRILVFGLIGLGILIFFLPAILVNSPLKQHAIDYALADLKGSARVENISVGWFSPVQIEGVDVRDDSGTTVLSIDSITTSQTLAGFLFSSDYGVVKIDSPTVDMRLRDGGSNLEDLLSAYLEPTDSDSSSEIPKVRVEIQNAVASIRSDSLDDVHVLENANFVLQCMHDEVPVAIDLQFDAVAADKSAGSATAKITVDEGQATLTGNNIHGEVDARSIPVSVLAPLITRMIGPTNCAGAVDARFAFDADIAESAASVAFNSLRATNIALVSPGLLGSDQFSAASASLSGELHVSPRLITASSFKAESEFARIVADGEFDIQQITQLASGKQIPQSGFQLDGTLYLARVAQMFPETMRLRDQVRLNSGIVQIQANVRNENGSPRLVINGDAANMDFTVEGQNIVWQRPVRFVGIAAQQEGRLRLTEMQLQSEFLSVSGNAALEGGQLQLSGDLKKATNQLGQVLDLGGLQASGIIEGDLNWTIRNAGESVDKADTRIPLQVNGRFVIQNPDFFYPGFKRWQQDQLQLALAAETAVSTTGVVAVDAAKVDLRVGRETAAGILNEPIDDLVNARKFQFNCQASGSIANWMEHARNFAEIPQFAADGNLNSQFLLTLNPRTCRLNQLRFEASDFRFDGFGLQIREPNVTGKTNLKYDFNQSTALFTKGTISTPSVAAATQELMFDISQKLLADGKVSFRANLNRASNWIGLSMPGDSVRWDGSAEGSMDFSSESGMFGGDLNVAITDLAVFQPSATQVAGGIQAASSRQSYAEVWREPRLVAASTLRLADDFNSVQLGGLDVQSKLADIQAEGTISDLAGAMNADVSGRSNVNWVNVNQTVREAAGDIVMFEGRGWQPFAIRGPLFASTETGMSNAWIPPQLSAVTAIAWNRASVFNMPLRGSQVNIQINQSMATLSSDTRDNLVGHVMQLQPVVDMRQADPVLNVGQGRLLDQWQITADDSRTWLKYAAPLMADATSAQGVVSIDLEGAQVPLFNPMISSARGTIQVHELTVGPGPLTRQLVSLVNQVRALLKPGSSTGDQTVWLQMKPQTLPVTVQRGRVFHDGLEMNHKDFTIRTRGSVGFDQTLNLTAEVPIQASWLGNNRTLAPLSGKTISIPIAGTLTRPRIDPGIIRQMTQKLLRESAIGALNEKVSGELGQFQEKVGNKIQGEVNRFQDEINDKIQNDFENRLQNELRNGLNNLFGGGKDKK
jgi:translocation and assembly module TamB